MNNFIPCYGPQMILPNCPNGVYVEVDNNTDGVIVHFTIQYTLDSGRTSTLTSPILTPQNKCRLAFPTRAKSVLVWIYNDLTTPPTVLTEGMLLRIVKTCFEVNGTPQTARCREVRC